MFFESKSVLKLKVSEPIKPLIIDDKPKLREVLKIKRDPLLCPMAHLLRYPEEKIEEFMKQAVKYSAL